MSTIKANTLLHSDGTTTTQPSIPALDKRMAKAWVNFNGTGTVAIRDSYNVSSITDVATGKYNINFATAMANINYSAALNIHHSPNSRYETAIGFGTTYNFETTRCQLITGISVYGSSNNDVDQTTVTGIFFGS